MAGIIESAAPKMGMNSQRHIFPRFEAPHTLMLEGRGPLGRTFSLWLSPSPSRNIEWLRVASRMFFQLWLQYECNVSKNKPKLFDDGKRKLFSGGVVHLRTEFEELKVVWSFNWAERGEQDHLDSITYVSPERFDNKCYNSNDICTSN
jgi:hypothetical protein